MYALVKARYLRTSQKMLGGWPDALPSLVARELARMPGAIAYNGRADIGRQMLQQERRGAFRVVGLAYHIAPGTVADNVTKTGSPVDVTIALTGFDGRQITAVAVEVIGADDSSKKQSEMAGAVEELAQHWHGVYRVEDVSHDAQITVISCD